jgi:hypothetical protein
MMTAFFLTLTLTGAAAARDVPPGKPAAIAEEPDRRLVEVRLAWVRATNAVKQAHVRFTMTQLDGITRAETVTRGEAWWRKPDLLRVDLKRDDEQGPGQFFVCKGNEFHLFAHGEELVFPLRQPFDLTDLGIPKARERDPWFFGSTFGEFKAYLQRRTWPLVGFPVKQLPNRFELRLAKEDEHWICLELKPRRAVERKDVRLIQVVLHRKEGWVRRVYERQPDNEFTIDCEKPDTATPVSPGSISKGLPVGWKRVEMPVSESIASPGK